MTRKESPFDSHRGERVPASLRGYLTRWMLEIHPGIFVGTVSARVRDALWDRLVVKRRKLNTAVLLLHSTAGEQGFTMLAAGTGSRRITDFDGLLLLRKTASHVPARSAASADKTETVVIPDSKM